MKWKGFRDIQATIEIGLKGKSEEELFRGLDRSRRKNVNRAKKEGLVFKKADEEDWKKYYKIYSSVWIEGGVNPQKIEELKIPENELFVVKDNEKVIGGGLIEVKENGINFVAFASLIEFQDKRVNDFLYWNFIKYALDKKMDYVDLGGYQLKARGHMKGINSFKEKWGGEIKKYYVHSKNPFYILGRKAIRNSAAARYLWDRLKKRPVSLKDEKRK